MRWARSPGQIREVNTMIRRVTVLVAGMAMLATPALIAQEEQGDGAEMRQRAPRGEMHQRMQRGEMRQRGPGMQMGLDRAIGRLMDRQNELNLTDDQLDALNDLRGEAQSAVGPLQEQMKTVRDGMRDGSLDREAAHNAMQGLHEQMSGAMEGVHGQLSEILDEEQRAALHQGRAQRARQGAMRGRMQRQRGRMQRQHQRMQERKEADEESASVDG